MDGHADCSRDRLAFSKSILRRFIRDCVDRDAAVASPWIVKSTIAIRYGIDTIMPEETRKGVEDLKKGESDKRKKLWEEKEGPPTKRQKKLAAEEEKGTPPSSDEADPLMIRLPAKALAAAAERREREAREKEEKAQKAKEESERLAAEKKKKKPVRYPTEDLDVVLGDKEKKAGMKVRRPIPSRAAMPFGRDNATNEAFLMAWNFLVVYGYVIYRVLSRRLNELFPANLCTSHLSIWTSSSRHYAIRLLYRPVTSSRKCIRPSFITCALCRSRDIARCSVSWTCMQRLAGTIGSSM